MGVEVGDTVSGQGGETVLRENSPLELTPCEPNYPDPRCSCPAALPSYRFKEPGATSSISLQVRGCGQPRGRGHHNSMWFRTSDLPVTRWVWLIYLVSTMLLLPASDAVINMGNPDAKRLYDDLLSNYNKLVRPVQNTTDPLTVRIKLKLSQLIDVNLKNQIMTTNLWVEQFWRDYKLKWEPEEYGGVKQLHVPSDHIWRPDIVLYNNADGNFEVTLATKATLWYNGLVEWKPPAIYKSSCEIDVEYFPFDEQTCVMKFGSWTYDGFQVDLRHMCEVEGSNIVDLGIDLSEFYMSVEWDILEVPAVRNEKFYTCCDEPYLDITFNITMRRKTLFYTVNLIIPCMGISFLTVLTFYLPSDSGEKVTLSISILTSLYVFFLLVVEIIPPTSLVVPLLGKYLIFAMILVSLSICVTVVVLNVHFRSPQTHKMAPWVKRVFIHILPRLLIMKRPQFQPDKQTSLRKVMLRTCIGTEGSNAKDYPNFAENKIRFENGNGDIVSGRGGGNVSGHGSGHGRVSQWGEGGATDLKEALSELLPEEIPGLPRHRPGEFSPRHYMADGGPFLGGCKLHGTSLDVPDPDEDEKQHFHDSSSPLDSPLPTASPVRSPLANGSPRLTSRGHTPTFDHSRCSSTMHKSCVCVNFIAEHTRAKEDATKAKEDWKYVAMVLDRLFLWIFTMAVVVGTAGIILQAPSLYDDRIPIDKELSDIGQQIGQQHKNQKMKSERTRATC